MYTEHNEKEEKNERYNDIEEEERLTELYNSVCVGDHRMTIEMVKSRPNLINQPCVNWKQGGYELPIAAAVRLKQNDIAYLLLSHGSKLETQEPGEGITALQWASAHGNVVLLEVLLKSGAKINHKGPNNNTALHFAVLYEQLDSVVCLLENGAEQVLNNFHLMPMHLACLQSVTPIVKQFLKLIKQPDDFLNDEYVKAFEIACVHGRIEVAKMWLTYFEMNFSNYVVKTREFMEKVNFFSILKEWVEMFEGEEVSEGEGDFEEEYWRHMQILNLFLSYNIHWARPMNHQGRDEDLIFKLFCLHPCSLLCKTFLIHCPLKNLSIPPSLINQASKHATNDQALAAVFRAFRFEVASQPTLDSPLTTTTNPFSDVHLHRQSQHNTNIPSPTTTPPSHGTVSTAALEQELITTHPLLSLQETCRRSIRECIVGEEICNVIYRIPFLNLPASLEKYLVFS